MTTVSGRSLRRALGAAGAVLALVLALCALGCAESAAPPRGVVLVVVDTLRADRLGVHGYQRPTSPRLDALAADGVLFRQAVSPAPWTLPSLATLMTSLNPSVHGAHSPSDLSNLSWYFNPKAFHAFSSLHESRTTLAETLRDAGFATYGAVQGSYPTEVFGMGQGFGVYQQNRTPGVRFDVEDALAWLDGEQPDRFFVYLHVMEVHAPYTPPGLNPAANRKLDPDRMPYFEEAIAQERDRFLALDFDPDYRGNVDGSRENLRFLSRVRMRPRPRDVAHLNAIYDQGIAYVDYWLGELVDGLRQRGLLDELVLVVTSDHGEEFFEHGRLEHSFSYYEEMLHVPLIVRVPNEGRGAVVEQAVGLVDVMPTLLDVLGVAGPEGMQGRSVRPLWRAASLPPAEYLGEASMNRADRALRGDGFKYIRKLSPHDGKQREELYDLKNDPGERLDRCADEPAECARLRERLTARMQEQQRAAAGLAAPDAANIDDETRESLKALGYLE